MKKLKVEDEHSMICALQDEIHRNEESRYDHRLHGVLLVAQGWSCREVASTLGDSPRTVENWVHQFNKDGFAGLAESPKAGRPRKLSEEEIEQAQQALRLSPFKFGLKQNLWDGKALRAYLLGEFGIELTVRQCQRLFRQWGFRFRKPRPSIDKADPQLQITHKKTPQTGS